MNDNIKKLEEKVKEYLEEEKYFISCSKKSLEDVNRICDLVSSNTMLLHAVLVQLEIIREEMKTLKEEN